MDALPRQIQEVVARCNEGEDTVRLTAQKVAEASQLAYTVNCLWLYSTQGSPSKETLTKALPPPVSASRKDIESGLEYIRKSLIVARSLLSEKMVELAEVKAGTDNMVAGLASFLAAPLPAIESNPIKAEEIEDITEALVPMEIDPKRKKERLEAKQEGRELVRKKTDKVRQSRPWIFT